MCSKPHKCSEQSKNENLISTTGLEVYQSIFQAEFPLTAF